MRFLLIVGLALLCSLHGYAQESSRFIRLLAAKDVIERLDTTDVKSLDKVLTDYAITSRHGGKRYKDVFPLPFDTLVIFETMMKSFSTSSDHSFSIDEPNSLKLKSEIGCPAPAKKRKFPCTAHSQLQNYLSGFGADTIKIRIVPLFYISRQRYDVPAEGYVAYTFADSFHDLHYTWYTLMVNIFKGDELIYYDQHTYFTEEVLPEDETPEIHIPQSAMDSLVTLTMQGYVDRLK